MAAGLKHFDAYSVETNRVAFNGNISTFDLWDTETAVRFATVVNANKHARDPVDPVVKTLNGGADMELGETYFTTNGCLEQVVQHNGTTIDTVNNTVRRVLKDSFIMGQWYASMSARPVDPSLPSSHGRCISECPDNGEYELSNTCSECHTTRVLNATPPDAINCLLCDGNLISRALPTALSTTTPRTTAACHAPRVAWAPGPPPHVPHPPTPAALPGPSASQD
ncbi:hypothetical protein PTSG_11754 [Salpingoeca rosetta]|uniref:Uncharacterized protein n=1 Tax=Salpingoeca rosetta (strain ATCC 50818 / BSB-021) TaxID=946362 RepID=F2U0R3_SALR5|nr:uncharacterized protein PTSG_11754 [Salpingoeca rosetta]EGD80991.1 hypothetical protein PTSG_11754 [Salpingoeca rosetta]|eukprot:XP_004997552.1 hypothetical protein PTSG_11754 [Salpingoeca rosetta]